MVAYNKKIELFEFGNVYSGVFFLYSKMGQYYFPIFLNNGGKVMAWVHAHEYNNGLKLMEHSYIDNNFVNAVETELRPEGRFYMSNFVWAGDYADNEPGLEENLYHICTDDLKINPSSSMDMSAYQYIVNHTKKMYVNKARVPERFECCLHPLPLLTCEGNGRGGGDFRGSHPLIGSWARDRISVETMYPPDFNELFFDLAED